MDTLLAQFESEHPGGFTNRELPHQGHGQHFFIRVNIHKFTLSLTLLSPPNPSFSGIHKVKKFY
jgi:hypothetical protein